MGCRLSYFRLLGPRQRLEDITSAIVEMAPAISRTNADIMGPGFVFWVDDVFKGFTFSEEGVRHYLAETAPLNLAEREAEATNKRVEMVAQRFVAAAVADWGEASALARARRMLHEYPLSRNPKWLRRAIEILEKESKP
jgi:hypothetical protein